MGKNTTGTFVNVNGYHLYLVWAQHENTFRILERVRETMSLISNAPQQVRLGHTDDELSATLAPRVIELRLQE